MKTHHNYVIEFSDGSCKVGVTSRVKQRLVEVKRTRKHLKVLQWMLTPACERASAFKTERDLCRLLRDRALPGAREWYAPRVGEFRYLVGSTGMFWQMNAPVGTPYKAEVSAA